MELNESTYFSENAGREFMSVSQFKNFQKCEAAAIAELNGTYIPERGRALLLGNYVDERLTGTTGSFEKFIEENRNTVQQQQTPCKKQLLHLFKRISCR